MSKLFPVSNAAIVCPLSIDRTMFVQDRDGHIYKISEGTGDNLEQKDIDDGYVDYIYYDIFCSLEDLNEDIIDDGGMILLKKFYKDHSVDEILSIVSEFCCVDFMHLGKEDK